jgi:cold-inducible RNA-binding protein
LDPAAFVLPASVPLFLHAPEVASLSLSNLPGVCLRLYVGNLSFNTGEPQGEPRVAPLGGVDSVRIVRDHVTGRSRGFAFVEMTDATQARAACAALDQREVDGRRLTVNEAKPQESRTGGFAGDGLGKKREARW